MLWDFFGEGMCWHSSTATGFCNDTEHVRPRWMLRTWLPPLSPSTVSCDRFWFRHNLSPRLSSSCFLWAFSRISFIKIDDADWPLPLQCFPRVFGSGFSFHGSFLLCWFCDYELILGFWVWICTLSCCLVLYGFINKHVLFFAYGNLVVWPWIYGN